MSPSVAPQVGVQALTGDIATVFGALPAGLRIELLREFNKVVRNFREGRWEPAELDGGKLCEVVYSVVRGRVDGKYPTKATKPKNMTTACAALENASPSFPRSIRLQIPRTLVALYGVRNDRSVGHVGGDVNPNHMDASLVLAMSKWLVAELVRLFHGVDSVRLRRSAHRSGSAVNLAVRRDPACSRPDPQPKGQGPTAPVFRG
jgi:hypothetical protein